MPLSIHRNESKLQIYKISFKHLKTFRLPQPILLSKVIQYFSGVEQMSKNEAYIWASILVLSLTVYTFLMHPCVHAMMHVGMKFRIACSSLIFRKILKISKTSLETETTVGQVKN